MGEVGVEGPWVGYISLQRKGSRADEDVCPLLLMVHWEGCVLWELCVVTLDKAGRWDHCPVFFFFLLVGMSGSENPH